MLKYVEYLRDRLRVGIVNYSDTSAPGGINRYVHCKASSLADRGIEVTVIEPRRVAEEEVDANYASHFISAPRYKPPWNLSRRFSNEVVSWIQVNEPDIIQVNGYMHLLSHQLIKTIKKRTDVKIVFTPHFDISTSTRSISAIFPIFNSLIGGKTVRNSDLLTFNSNFESRAFEQAVGKITIPKITIPIGIEISPGVKDSIWDRELRLSYFGHLIKRKRADRLLNLAKEITNNYPDIDLKVSIVGEGDEERNLRKLSESLGLDDVVQWHGFMERDKMIESLADSTFFVLLSDSEAFAITVAESLMLGTMVVVSDNTALSEYGGEPGCILAKNPDDFASVARKIIDTRGKVIKIGPFSERIQSWGEVSKKYIQEYSNLVGG